MESENTRLRRLLDNRKEYACSLEAEIHRLHVAYTDLQDRYKYVCEENDRLFSIGSKPADEVFAPLIENAALQHRIRELSEALREAVEYIKSPTVSFGPWETTLPYKIITRAAALLAQPATPSE